MRVRMCVCVCVSVCVCVYVAPQFFIFRRTVQIAPNFLQ